MRVRIAFSDTTMCSPTRMAYTNKAIYFFFDCGIFHFYDTASTTKNSTTEHSAMIALVALSK